jgi:predicted O-methyltransferase YrrM
MQIVGATFRNIDVRVQIHRFALLVRSRPPLIVILVYFSSLVSKLIRRMRDPDQQCALMRDLDRDGTYTTRWFDGNAVEWMRIFQSQRLQDKPIRALEIGSWEGRSTVFLLHHLPKADVTAVDTWQGGPQYSGDPRLAHIEELFDANVARYGARLRKIKSTSAEFFRSCGHSPPFDFIYVDGSHDADDVMVDAMCGFELLAAGGIMIFDDYLWDRRGDPAAAINRFLRMKQGSYRILSVTAQIILKKLS